MEAVAGEYKVARRKGATKAEVIKHLATPVLALELATSDPWTVTTWCCPSFVSVAGKGLRSKLVR